MYYRYTVIHGHFAHSLIPQCPFFSPDFSALAVQSIRTSWSPCSRVDRLWIAWRMLLADPWTDAKDAFRLTSIQRTSAEANCYWRCIIIQYLYMILLGSLSQTSMSDNWKPNCPFVYSASSATLAHTLFWCSTHTYKLLFAHVTETGNAAVCC